MPDHGPSDGLTPSERALLDEADREAARRVARMSYDVDAGLAQLIVRRERARLGRRSPRTGFVGYRGRRPALTTAASAVVATVAAFFIAATLYVTTSPTAPDLSPGRDLSPSGTASTAAAPVPPGTVQITNLVSGDVVDRCVRVRGRANLDPGKTLLFATNRTSPADSVWYFTYVGNYRNGFVPVEWSGTVYLGSASRQAYDLFVVVMDVGMAEAFWESHQSKDGSYAFASARPTDLTVAAHVRILQGSTDDC
jgi:hypothetical protein